MSLSRFHRLLAALAGLAGCLPAPTFSQDAGAGPAVSVLQKQTEEWIATRRLIGEEAAAWQAEKASLGELNEIRAKESVQLDDFVNAAGARIAELSSKQADLAEERSSLKAWRAALEADLGRLEAGLRPLLPRFPAPLREKIEESLLRLEAPEPDQPIQNRARDVLLVLQACLEFHNTITVDSEVREIAGERREIEVLYLGLTQAWYVDASGKHSGLGVPGGQGWIWTEDNALAGPVRSAIEIQSRRATPAFVELPLSNGAGKEAAK